MLSMNVPEKMCPWMNLVHSFQKFFRPIMDELTVDTVIKVKDSINRRVSDQDIRVIRYIGIISVLLGRNAILVKHRYAIESDAVYLYA